MGSFLDKPKTEKEQHAEENSSVRLKAGLAAMQGWRVDMEDSHSIKLSIDGAPELSWFAVFDGHGGAFTSRYAADNVLNKITSTQEWSTDRMDPEVLGKAMVRGFLQIDEDLKKTPDVQRGDEHSGSTAISAIVTPTHIVCGNVGDSRCILVKLNEVIEMSVDHKPYNQLEQERIEKAGGTVTMRRVNGDLAVSRALGDFVYKHSADLPPEKQQVSAEPEIRFVARTPDADAFLVLACDGVWDVMSNAEVGEFLLDRFRAGVEALDELAGALIDECLARGSRDNMSAVIVMFPGAPVPSRETVENYRKARLGGGAAAVSQDGAAVSTVSAAGVGDSNPRTLAADDDEAQPPRVPQGIDAAGPTAATLGGSRSSDDDERMAST